MSVKSEAKELNALRAWVRRRKEVSEEEATKRNAALEAFAVVIGALAASACCAGWHCYQFWDCSSNDSPSTCARPTSLDGDPLSYCSFSNVVSPAGDALYNTSALGLKAVLQATCVVGERLGADSSCMPHRSYPDALDDVIMDPDASQFHDQACGKWITAASSDATKPVYWSLYDRDEWSDALLSATSQLFKSPSLSTTNVGKFYDQCVTTVAAGSAAMHASALNAYDFIVNEMIRSTNVTNTRDALLAMGSLVGHSCDASVSIGFALYGNGYAALVYEGVSYPEEVLSEALFAVTENWNDQLFEDAEAANRHVKDNAWNSPAASTLEIAQLLKGAFEEYVDENTTTAAYIQTTAYLDGFIHLAKTEQWDLVNAFLKGSAAMCAFAISDAAGVFGTTDDGVLLKVSHVRVALDNIARSKAPASALGRLKVPSDNFGDGMFDIDANSTIINASSITLAQLRAAPLGDPDEDCMSLTRALFPDEMDTIYHDLVVTPLLSERLRAVTESTRHAVHASVLSNRNFTAFLSNEQAVADAVLQARIRIPGAPRGSWAGAARDIPMASFASDDGVVVMAFKQARSVYVDRVVELAFKGVDLCEGPPTYDSLTANAYIYPSIGCSYYLFGMLHRPWADEMYDDTSLALRIGYVIGHELSHLSMVTSWPQATKDALLHRYPANVHNEAIADLIAGVALVENGTATKEEFCMHVSQLWCARMPPLYVEAPGATHPAPNFRGDALCETMNDILS
tara:strand:+ start:6365 stop:8593 length:2229 start_codon:yes stop_codon:yes gene_type:complete